MHHYYVTIHVYVLCSLVKEVNKGLSRRGLVRLRSMVFCSSFSSTKILKNPWFRLYWYSTKRILVLTQVIYFVFDSFYHEYWNTATNTKSVRGHIDKSIIDTIYISSLCCAFVMLPPSRLVFKDARCWYHYNRSQFFLHYVRYTKYTCINIAKGIAKCHNK